MKKAIILLFILLSNSSFAQKTKIATEVSSQIKIFEENNIKSFYIVERYCIGCTFGSSKFYAFWNENGESYFKEIDKPNSQKVKIPEDIFSNHFEKSHRIRNEKIKQYQTGKDKFTYNAHGFYSKFYFIVDRKLEIRVINYFDLTTEKKRPNLNFEYNNSLSLVQLDKVCDEIIRRNE